MRLKQTKALLLSLSEDGVVIIAEVNRKAEEQKKKNYTWRREYYISESCLKANLERGTFKNISGKVDYDGRIYALADDLA
ncbi:MAG: hypothetical protein CL512_05725 [Actinobacteria bacterium]|jgi:hypothetical protein|nr:hypothetical protein [Actinomycetota bacterium]|tara:strand:+ start:2499 stop:2738 length:240 start_codon:yes stop_codon:yes gene_type:complete